MDCVIYVDSGKPVDEMTIIVADTVNGAALGRSALVQCNGGELDVRRNTNAAPVQATGLPDDFLHFRYRVELYPRAESTVQDRIILTSKLLERFWSLGLPAVAACDYEDSLPKQDHVTSQPVRGLAAEQR